MTFKWFRLLPIAVISIMPGLSQAQTLCDPAGREQEEALRSALPEGKCKRERIEVSGNSSLGVLRSAESLANRDWRDTVVTKYGEQWAEVKYMACRRVLCVKGALAGSRRCTISGFPCKADMTEQEMAQIRQLDVAAPVGPVYGPGQSEDLRSGWGYHRPAEESSLDEGEIKRLQEMLGVTPDGDFGSESYRALRDFRRNAGLRMEGPPSREDLERLAKTERRQGYGR